MYKEWHYGSVELTIKIEVELIGVFEELAGRKVASLEFDHSKLVKDVILQLANMFPAGFKQALLDPELGVPRANVLILLNNMEIGVLNGVETRISNGDKLVLIPVSHGG